MAKAALGKGGPWTLRECKPFCPAKKDARIIRHKYRRTSVTIQVLHEASSSLGWIFGPQNRLKPGCHQAINRWTRSPVILRNGFRKGGAQIRFSFSGGRGGGAGLPIGEGTSIHAREITQSGFSLDADVRERGGVRKSDLSG